MKIGANDISAVKIGATDVNKVYLGSNLVWEKAGATLLLDLYPNAAAAYSLRKLRTAYAGASIKVRRSSDNTEQDIGFVDGELDTVSLLDFVGAGDGFVTTWYDQSGAGNDLTQAAAASQAQVVEIGTLIYKGFKITTKFIGGQEYDMTGIMDFTLPPSIFCLASVNGNSQNIYNLADGSTYMTFGSSISGANISNRSATAGSRSIPQSYEINTINSNILADDSYFNGLQSTGASATRATTLTSNLGTAGSFFLNGTIQEFILYPSDQTSNRVAIESNINNYYTIY